MDGIFEVKKKKIALPNVPFYCLRAFSPNLLFSVAHSWPRSSGPRLSSAHFLSLRCVSVGNKGISSIRETSSAAIKHTTRVTHEAFLLC